MSISLNFLVLDFDLSFSSNHPIFLTHPNSAFLAYVRQLKQDLIRATERKERRAVEARMEVDLVAEDSDVGVAVAVSADTNVEMDLDVDVGMDMDMGIGIDEEVVGIASVPPEVIVAADSALQERLTISVHSDDAERALLHQIARERGEELEDRESELDEEEAYGDLVRIAPAVPAVVAPVAGPSTSAEVDDAEQALLRQIARERGEEWEDRESELDEDDAFGDLVAAVPVAPIVIAPVAGPSTSVPRRGGRCKFLILFL